MAYGALPSTFRPHKSPPLRNARTTWRSSRTVLAGLILITLIFYFADPYHHHRTTSTRNSPRVPNSDADNNQKVLEKLQSSGGDPLSAKPGTDGKGQKWWPGSTAASAGKVAGSKLFPDEWDAIEQERQRKQQDEQEKNYKIDEEARRRKKEGPDVDKPVAAPGSTQPPPARKPPTQAPPPAAAQPKVAPAPFAALPGRPQAPAPAAPAPPTPQSAADREKARAKDKAEAQRLKAEDQRKQAELADIARSRDHRPATPADWAAQKEVSHPSTSRLTVTLDKGQSGKHDHPDSADHQKISSTLVMGRLAQDPLTVMWVHVEVANITHKQIYIVDDPKAELHLKKNKGREAMVYLRYILDHYYKLDDVTLFFHNSREAWHNSIMFNRDAAIMINNLNKSYVMEQGYVNARCELYPGCPKDEPGWLKFNPTYEEHMKQENRNADLFKLDLWDQLFPNRDQDPVYLSQPCCSQFAVSRDKIRSIPLSAYQRIHDWLGTAEENDVYTGRIMEYTWQYLFNNQDQYCPDMVTCYCNTYGLCLKGTAARQLNEYNAARGEIDSILTAVEAEDKERGCHDIDAVKEPAREKACRTSNSHVPQLTKTRARKMELERSLPRQYGILKPGGKAGDGVGKVSGMIEFGEDPKMLKGRDLAEWYGKGSTWQGRWMGY